MDRIRIKGGRPLTGKIPISGAKNAGLPLMAACLLTDEALVLSNLPDLVDITTMADLLAVHGVDVSRGESEAAGELTLCARDITNTTAPYDLVRRMRASVLVLGPLVARAGEARVSMPGGCAIGTRPIDLHLKGLEALGVNIALEDGYVHARAPKGLHGATVRFPMVSVGATENLLMAAALARGTTVLENAAREPEVTDLAHCLVAMGARISGIGTARLVIDGVARLNSARYRVLPDRIEAGSYAIAAAITGGTLELVGARPDIMGATLAALAGAGVGCQETDDGIRIAAPQGRPQSIDIVTQPYPGLATDLQAQMMALMTLAEGASMITETIFENRFMHVPELTRMGADIAVHGGSAMVRGVTRLRGAPVMATDLRASVCLVLAGLAAEGETIINRVYHLDRGYQHLVSRLAACGGEIERIDGGKGR